MNYVGDVGDVGDVGEVGDVGLREAPTQSLLFSVMSAVPLSG